jgi:hypothetical protein
MFFMPLLSPKNSLTLALSLLEGEGITPENASLVLGEIHLSLYFNSIVNSAAPIPAT